VLLASRVLLFTVPKFPDPLIGDLIRSSFPTLVAHAQSVLAAAFAERPYATNYRLELTQSFSVRSLLPSATSLFKRDAGNREARKKTEEQIRFKRWRWLWIGAAAFGTVAYLAFMSTQIQIRLIKEDEDTEENESGEEVDEEYLAAAEDVLPEEEDLEPHD
jgi:sorting and assembly machinery component 37